MAHWPKKVTTTSTIVAIWEIKQIGHFDPAFAKKKPPNNPIIIQGE